MKNDKIKRNRLSSLLAAAILIIGGTVGAPAALAQQPQPLQNNRSAQEMGDRPDGPPDLKQKPILEAFRPQNSFESRLLIAALGLTPEQLRRIQDVYRQNGQTLMITARDMRLKRAALDEALFSDDFSESVVTQRAREFAEAQTQVVLMQTKIQAQIRQILTTEQVHKFLDLRQVDGARPIQKELRKELRQNRKF